MRAFVAIPMPEEAVAPIVALQSLLGCGRAVAEENLHLTLAFLGEISLAEAQALDEELAAIPTQPLVLELAGADVMDRARPDLVFVGLRKNPPLEALQRHVAAAARAVGIDLARRRFRPHVTLARFGRAYGPAEELRLGRFLEASADFSLPGFAVGEFVLYRSTLDPHGPRYDRLAEYPIGDLPGSDWAEE